MRLEVAPAEVPIVPGVPAIVIAQVFNTDDVINAYGVRVFGVDPTWVRLDEQRLSLFPGTVGLITVQISVPPSYPAGELRVGIEVTPLVDATRSQIGEATLVVPAVKKATMAMDPAMLVGGRRGQFNLTLGNDGNAPIDLTFSAVDPEDKVRVAFTPPTVHLEPKQQVIVPARATGPRPWFGNPAARMVSFTATGADNPLETLASFVQRPRLGRGLMSLFGLLVAVSIFALVFTHTLGRVVDVAKIDNKLLERAVNGPGADRGVVDNPATAAGKVTLLNSGSGVSGVTVELFALDNPTAPVASAASGTDGSYKLGGLPAGNYKLRFRGAGFVELWYGGGLSFEEAKEITLAAGKDVGGLDIALGGVPGSIAGKVIGADVKDAVVTLNLPSVSPDVPTPAQVAQVTAGADGAFLLEKVPAPATYQLVVTKEGFATESRQVNLAAAEAKTNVEVTLRKGDGLLSGTVSAGGKPLGGVNVTATSTTNTATGITLTSGAIGTYTLRNLPTPGTYTITFAKTGYATQTVTVALEQGEQHTGTDVTLSSGSGSIAGTVSRQGSGPVGGVTVSVGVADKSISTLTLSVGDVGSYLLTGLPVPGTYTVTFSGAGLATQVRSIDLDARTNPNLIGVDASMTASTAVVSGTVNDETGPADGVTVTLTNGTDTWTTTSASAPLGSYKLRDITPGTYTLTFSRDGSVPQSVLLSLTAGESRTVNVTLARRASVAGHVYRTGSGTSTVALAGAQVIAYRIKEYPGTIAAQTVTAADGSYTLSNLSAPDTYIIEFAFPAGSTPTGSQQFQLQAGQQKTGVDATLTLGA